MRRIVLAVLMLAALAGSYWACNTDAPAPTPPTTLPTPGASPLLIALFTTDANPTAGGCTLIQAIVTFNGQAVADGTGVSFSTDFGVFAQNGTPVVSITTQKGSALAVLCSSSSGTAFVNATATVSGVTARSDQLKIVFQPAGVPVPFVTNCSPTNGPNTGGTILTINGGNFLGNTASTRATITAAGVTREAVVTAVVTDTFPATPPFPHRPNSVTLTVPAFPEATSSTPVTITVSFLANSGSPINLSVPNCFVFGTVATGTPNITAVLPSSGTKDGNTRVSIIGSGFVAPLQVFFVSGTVAVEATVVSISPSLVVALSPPAFEFGTTPPPINTPIDIRVHEVASGCTPQPSCLNATLVAAWRYTLPIEITGISPLQMRADQIVPVTIFGHGFLAPVLVTIGGTRATVTSVSDTEILVLPGSVAGCTGGGGTVSVTNLSTGETASSSQSLTITAVLPTITSIVPAMAAEGATVTINGTNLPTSAALTKILFGTVVATPTAFDPSGNSITVTAPAGAATAAVCPVGTPAGTPLPAVSPTTVTVTNLATTCSTTGSFRYLLPCTVAPDLAVVKTGADTVLSGANLVYTITVSNIGTGSAANTTMTDPIPAGTTFVSCTPTAGTCTNSSGTVTAAIGTLPPSGVVTLTLTVHVTAPALTVLGNTATVATTTPEPNLSNNVSTKTTTVM